MKLRLNISTCPNDTFMFDAMIHRRIDTEGLEFDLFMGDIEELNREALQGTPHISKLSYAVVPRVSDRYQMLNSGSALGRGNGPLLVSRHKLYPDELGDVCVAIPGEYTTANYVGYAPYDNPTVSFACSAPTSADNAHDLKGNACTNYVMPEVLDAYFELYPASE